MSEFRLSPEAEAELDGIWIHIAGESGSADIATRVVEGITERFWLLARHPYVGRRRDDLRSGLRSLAANDYVMTSSRYSGVSVPLSAPLEQHDPGGRDAPVASMAVGVDASMMLIRGYSKEAK
jgi:plasmid stabilization system protein ParE